MGNDSWVRVTNHKHAVGSHARNIATESTGCTAYLTSGGIRLRCFGVGGPALLAIYCACGSTPAATQLATAVLIASASTASCPGSTQPLGRICGVSCRSCDGSAACAACRPTGAPTGTASSVQLGCSALPGQLTGCCRAARRLMRSCDCRYTHARRVVNIFASRGTQHSAALLIAGRTHSMLPDL